jgi:hypothetical protein
LTNDDHYFVYMSNFSLENKFPDCVFMKLRGAPVEQEASSILVGVSPSTTFISATEVDLKLTLRFGRQPIKIPGGCVWISLKRGELRLKLDNGKIPLEKMGLVTPFETAVEVEQQQEDGRESETNIAVAAGVKAKDIRKQTSKAKFKGYKIRNRGLEEEPIWEFEAVGTQSLSGQLTEEFLGILEKNSKPCNLQATFTVRGQRDLILNGEGLWPKELSRNKLAVLEREFFRRFIEPKLEPYISHVGGEL